MDFPWLPMTALGDGHLIWMDQVSKFRRTENAGWLRPHSQLLAPVSLTLKHNHDFQCGSLNMVCNLCRKPGMFTHSFISALKHLSYICPMYSQPWAWKPGYDTVVLRRLWPHRQKTKVMILKPTQLSCSRVSSKGGSTIDLDSFFLGMWQK